jgi:hypothetical protein
VKASGDFLSIASLYVRGAVEPCNDEALRFLQLVQGFIFDDRKIIGDSAHPIGYIPSGDLVAAVQKNDWPLGIRLLVRRE